MTRITRLRHTTPVLHAPPPPPHPTPMQVHDIDTVVTLENAVQPAPWTRGHFIDALHAGYPAWVLRETDTLIAFAVLMYAPDIAHLLNIAVQPHRQQQGWGKIMLHWCVTSAAQRGLGLLLEVRHSNITARRFYARHGFRQIGIRKNYYRTSEGQHEHAHVLQRELSPPTLLTPHADTSFLNLPTPQEKK